MVEHGFVQAVASMTETVGEEDHLRVTTIGGQTFTATVSDSELTFDGYLEIGMVVIRTDQIALIEVGA